MPNLDFKGGSFILPSTYDNGTTSGAIVTDFALSFQQKIAFNGNITGWTTANRLGSVNLDISSGASTVTLAFSNSWKWLTPKPTQLVSGTYAMLSLEAFGTAETDIRAAWKDYVT